MPESQDMDRIDEMLNELGEKELELGEIPEGSYPEASKKKQKAEPLVPPEEEPAPPAEEPGEEEFQELLKDISIGLTEEKELEERMAVPSEAELVPEEEVPLSEEEVTEPGPEVSETGAAGLDEELFPSLEELLGEETPAMAGEEPEEAPAPPPPPLLEEEEGGEPEQPPADVRGPEFAGEEELLPSPEEAEKEPGAAGVVDEEDLDLPIDFDLEDLFEEQGPPPPSERAEKIGEETVPEEQAASLEAETGSEAEEPEPVPSDEVGEEEEVLAAIEEEQPSEEEEPLFDLEGLTFEDQEETAEELSAEQVVEEPEEEEPSAIASELEEGIEAILSPPEGTPSAEGVEEAVPEEGAPPPEVSPEEAVEGLTFEDLEAIGLGEEEPREEPPEVPPVEELGEEELVSREGGEPLEFSGIELVEEPEPGEFEGFEEAEGPELPEIEKEEAAATGGEVMELSEDDIGQIKAKLSTLSPVLAATIQGIIVRGALPAVSMNGILELLIMDASEQELTEYVERVLGRKIVPLPKRPPAPAVVRKPGVLGALAENLGPFLRVAMLCAVIVVVLGALFMVFFYNPLRSRMYYQEALDQVRLRNFEGARLSIEQARKYQDRMPRFFSGVGQYDDLGWRFMLAGQYPPARTLFEEGIRREIDRGRHITNLRIFMRLAILNNLLGEYGGGEYGEAEEIYALVLDDLNAEKEVYPALVRNTEFYVRSGTLDGFEVAGRLAKRFVLNTAARYEFRMLRGENLMALSADQVGEDAVKAGETLDKAYAQFQHAARERKNDAAPLFKLMQIEMLRDDRERVDELFGEIQRRFPKAVDEEVQTQLARYYTGKESFSAVRDLLLKALSRKNMTYPYPPAYHAYAMYYRSVGNRASQEDFLNAALRAERSRVLPREWNFRDRMLVSWTDFGGQHLKPVKLARVGKKDMPVTEEEGIGQVQGELLFPWDSRDFRLLSHVYNDLGEMYAQIGGYEDTAQAILYYNKAIEQLNKLRYVRAEDARAYFNLAQMYFYRSKDYQLAKKYYQSYLDVGMRQNNGYAYGDLLNDLNYNLGYIYYQEGLNERRNNLRDRKFNQALDKWSDLALSMPENPHIGSAVGSTLLHLGAHEAALGEFLMLSEEYDGLVEMLGEIRPWRDQHERIVLEAVAVYNNLAVAYYGIAEEIADETEKAEYEKNALLSLYKAGELADLMGAERGRIQYNIQKIIHPDVARGEMAINDELSSNYRFSLYNVPGFD